MGLPGVENAVVPREKVQDYLLSFTHPLGRKKAQFFYRFGFTPEYWELLAEALVRHAEASDVAKADDTDFGMRYIVDGPLDAPDGRRPTIRVVWFVGTGETVPRLVTAYPGRERKKR